MTREEYSDKAKELIPVLKGLSVYDARMVLDAAVTEIQKAGTL